MGHSNSSVGTYVACQRKYWHAHINRTTPDKPPALYFAFGTMVHDVLEKEGNARDLKECGLKLTLEEVMAIIPSEVQHYDLKEFSKITNWLDYFIPVIEQCTAYEKELAEEHGGIAQIWRENKLQISASEVERWCDNSNIKVPTGIKQPGTGKVDLIILCNDGTLIIVDYKTGSGTKDQDDFDMNSQLYVYVLMSLYFMAKEDVKIDLNKIKIAYIDIPRQPTQMPRILQGGKVSVAMDQNCFGPNYAAAVAISLGYGEDVAVEDIPELQEGGHYYKCYMAMCMNKPAYLSYRQLDLSTYNAILEEYFAAIAEIESKLTDSDERNKLETIKRKFLTRFDAYTCKACEFVKSCKTWARPVSDL